MPRLWLVALIALLFVGCAPRSGIRSARPIAEIRPPELLLVPGRTSVERFDPPGAGARVALAIGTRASNPNAFPIKLTHIDYVVWLENRPVARGSRELDLFLEVGAMAPLDFALETELQNQPELLRSVVRAFAGEPLDFRIDGSVTFDSLSYEFRSQNRTLVEGSTLARESVLPPTLRLDEASSEVYLLRPDLPVLRLVVTAVNRGDIGYFLYGKDLVVTLGGQRVAVDDMRPVPVPAGETSRIDMLFYPDREALSPEAQGALDAALEGLPSAVALEGDLYMDVLGVDTFGVPAGWQVLGFVYGGR